MDFQQPPKEIQLSQENLHLFPSFQKRLERGEIVFDKKGKLRYPHGAPVGRLLLVRINKDGTPIYKEAADEWFDPESPFAQRFVWPT